MKPKTKIGSLTLAVCLAITAAMPTVVADSDKKITVTLEDVTSSANTLKGEAKVKVSVSGADGKATIAQMAFDFDGDLKYKSTQFLKGEDNPDNGNVLLAQKNGNKLMTSITAINGLNFNDSEDLFIITFTGNADDEITLKLSDLENTYCTVDGADRNADGEASITVTASNKENIGQDAVIRLAMDKISDFAVTKNSQITVKITNENVKGDVISKTVDASNDGRDGTTSIPTFIIKDTVIADNTYTVEIAGIGYVTYKKTGVKFGDELEITNSDFIPGDVDNDGDVDSDDKAMVEKFIADKDYSIAADFNRDGKVNASDLTVFDGIKDTTTDNKKDDSSGSTGGNAGSSSTGGSGGGGGTGGSGSGGSSGSSSGGSSSGGSSNGGTIVTPSNSETFTDLENHAWAKNSIYTLKNKGIISGISDTEFAPANNIKRGDFILILTRMFGINDVFTENFADVPESAYYYDAVGSAKAAGIASGYGDSFMPENTITRQDLITLAYRAFLNKGYIAETDDLSVLDIFSDKDDISEYAQKAMASMVKAGIIQGSDGLVNPKGNATRAEVAVMCARMLDLMK